jgi:hypothetical protein
MGECPDFSASDSRDEAIDLHAALSQKEHSQPKSMRTVSRKQVPHPAWRRVRNDKDLKMVTRSVSAAR